MKKVFIVLLLIIIAIILIVALFLVPYVMNNKTEVILGDEIILPDRIVYKNSNNQYYEFLKKSNEYNELINLVGNTLKNYTNDGDVVSQDTIDNIHNETFLEFDYETASKNYIIPFGNTLKDEMVKLSDTGGKICSTDLKNVNKIKKELDKKLTVGQKSYSLDYKEYISKNQFILDYKYTQQFKNINYKIYQVKIQDMKTYERYQEMCHLAFDDQITEDIFNDYDLILTASMVPKITVKVSVGNIRYTYEDVPNSYGAQYIAHLLVVSKIVNTDCIYNTDLSTVDQQASLDESRRTYDEQVDNLDENIFVKDFDSFSNEYTNSSSSITEDQAKEIANTAFDEASRIAGSYDKNSQTCKIQNVHPNNFFTRKSNETDSVLPNEITAYCFSREDEIGNGVTVYIDNKLGKVIGGEAFGD